MYTHVLQAQKEILDTELDIIAKQNEGADTSELRKRVAELKREVNTYAFLQYQSLYVMIILLRERF